MSVVEFKKKQDEWTAIEAVEFAYMEMKPETKVLVLYIDQDDKLSYTSANFLNHQLNFALDQVKLGMLLEN